MENYKFSAADIREMNSRGISEGTAGQQIDSLIRGSLKVKAQMPCIVSDGISDLSEIENQKFLTKFQEILNTGAIVSQLIPASGAASRMFKSLLSSVDKKVEMVLSERWRSFPFSEEIQSQGINENSGINEIIEAIVGDRTGLGLQNLPKGLVPFHRYSDGEIRTAFQEHAAEWRSLAGGQGQLCFTVPVAHEDNIAAHLADQTLNIAYTTQYPATDMLAWDLVRDEVLRENGHLVWRPGGHGALLRNLEEVGGDLVFIRNIDNVVDESGMGLRNRWQSVLGGRAWALKQQRDDILKALRNDESGAADRAREFLSPFVQFGTMPDSVGEWERQLDRPIRVAGMVANSGQPGGGPFWIEDAEGHLRPGIAESAELEPGLMESGTHFNPVELACILTDAEGKPYRLKDFADSTAFFTAEKTHGARPIRILEHPGLWNGGMAGWLTEFVEVPSEIFAPVKTVFDLLDRKPQRRA